MTDRPRMSLEDAIIIAKAAALYAAATVVGFRSMSVANRNKATERVVAEHFDDLWGFLKTERRRLGIKTEMI